MDQNISAAMVDSPDNKLKKGNAVSENVVFVETMTSRKIVARFYDFFLHPQYHWDLMVIGIINGVLCIFGLPFMHAGMCQYSNYHLRADCYIESNYDFFLLFASSSASQPSSC